nr:hypothetical protein RTCK_03513 [Rhizobium sp. TCK]
MDIAELSDDSKDTLAFDTSTLEKLHEILGNRTREFSGEHARAAAEQLAEQQKFIHTRLIDVIMQTIGRHDGGRWLEEWSSSFKGGVDRIRPGLFEEPIRLESNAPLIGQRDLDFLIKFIETGTRHNKSQAFLRPAVIICFYLRFSGSLDIVIRTNDTSPFNLFLQQAFSIVETFCQIRDMGSQAMSWSSLLEGQLTDAGARISSLEVSISQRRTTLEELLMRIEAAKATQDAIQSDLGDLPNKIESVETAMMAQLGLRETDKLWKREAQQATTAYYLSLTLLIFVLVGSPFAIYTWRNELLALITDFESAAVLAAQNNESILTTAIVIGRLALIALPVALLIWAVKLVVRFNTRSMLLMDDARHRVAMLNTFLFLLKQEAATIQDRGALLEALFRRTPGHGPETVEPPNLTDLMKYGKEIGGTTSNGRL